MLKLLTTLLAGTALVATAATAAGGNLSDAQARYQADRAACVNGESNQDRTTCLREAGAALREAKRGQLAEADERQYDQNRLIRCNPLPSEDREDCVRRMNGEGIIRGSVEEGGIYRELSRPVPAN